MLQDKVKAPLNSDIAMQTFLSTFLEDHAEWRPDKNERFLNSALIPSVRTLYVSFLTWHNDRHEDFGQPVDEIVTSESHFRKRFNEWYPEVKIPKTNKFAECDRCLGIKEKIRLTSGEKKDTYRKELAKHRDNVRKDKNVYYGNR